MLELLRAKYSNRKIDIHCESYFDFDLGDGIYDVALSVMTLHHYDHRKKTDLYRKIHRCLNDSGVYIECDWMFSQADYENPQAQEDFYYSEFERLKKEQGITDGREYSYDIST